MPPLALGTSLTPPYNLKIGSYISKVLPNLMTVTMTWSQKSVLQKQQLLVERVLSGALAWKHYPYDASKRKQMLLYVGGEGGVGKSQVIKAIVGPALWK